jgi:2-dehydro-3-deoxygluconokinase
MSANLDVVTLGEAMLRLSPPNFRRLEQATSFDVNIGGSELNVAVGVTRLGLKAAWVSKLPSNPLGRLTANKARELGVDTSHIVWSDGGRMGIYFVEFGAAPRPSSVLYDRKYSAASTLSRGEVDWSFLKERKVRLFHTSGITPALSRECTEATLEAIDEAKKAGCLVSFDVNYRAKLWSTKEAEAVMTPIVEKVDVVLTTDEDTWRVWGMKGTHEEIVVNFKDRFKTPVVAMTIREVISVWKNRWSSIAIGKDGKIYRSRRVYEVEIVDRLGAGDSYTAGFIYGYLDGDMQKAVDFGTAMGAIKHSIPGDFNLATHQEIATMVEKLGELRIQR